MDSWTLQGDSYSFLHSAPRTFSLCHRDGTPNHIDIFDIINVPSQQRAISETNCLCEIFVDDGDSPTLASGTAVGPFVPSQREADGTAAVSPLTDDLNDSSGSYHSAQGCSEGEEGFEDSRERLYSPQLHSKSSERMQPGGERGNSVNQESTEDSTKNTEPKSKSAVHLNTSHSSEVLNTSERTPFPQHNDPNTLNPKRRVSSSPIDEKGCLPVPTNPGAESELRRISPTIKGRHNNPSHESLTPVSLPDSRKCVRSPSPPSEHLPFLNEFRKAHISPEPRSCYFEQHSSHSPERTSDFPLHFTESSFETVSSLLPSSSSTELPHKSRETPVSPELMKRPYSPDSQTSSPFPELKRNISVPDLFSRGSTPDNFAHNPELTSHLSTSSRDSTTTPESQGTRLSTESDSTVSATQYTTPSPAISVVPSTELVESRVSPELFHTAPSPSLLGPASPFSTETSPSQVSSPLVSHSLSPSPAVISSYSPTQHRYTSPSPEIVITASSPEVHRKSESSEDRTTSASPPLTTGFVSPSRRSPTSSPDITGISYSVVQPEDRDSLPFPELSRLSIPEPIRTVVLPETRSPTPSRDGLADSSHTPEDYSHMLDIQNSIVQPEVTHQSRYQTPSPKPKNATSFPETITADKYQSPSSQLRSETSPVASSPEQRYHQWSPANLSREDSPNYFPAQDTPEFDFVSTLVDIPEVHYPKYLTKENVSPLFDLVSGDTSVTESKRRSLVSSPVSTSSLSLEEKVEGSQKQETEREAIPQEANHNSSVPFLFEEKQATGLNLFQEENICNNHPITIKSASPNLVCENSQRRSIHKTVSKSPVCILESPHSQAISYPPTSENISSFKPTCLREYTRGQLSTSDRRGNIKRLPEVMAQHVPRRRTPSPQLTRFTPVHIIAPQKPYRHWQNSSHTPHTVASSASCNLKKEVTNRENPSVTHVDNNSQTHRVRLGTQLEMERGMQLEEDRDVGKDTLKDRRMERGRVGEEQPPENGNGWKENSSYREEQEQVELSFRSRNRKGSESCRAAYTSRQSCQGLPTVHSSSESLFATRQLQQQQNLLGFASQQATGVGASGRQFQPPASQNKNSAARHVAINRSCQSSISSMGSELDEADNEVKWFTDFASSSLSSPEVDYLDMYNSSHCSSTNISRPSTQESPAGVSAAFLAYADFRGSAPNLESDEICLQQPPPYYSDHLDPSRRYEVDSFECIDVAMEREDYRKPRRGVPKRQIQLKRKENAEGKQDESSQDCSQRTLRTDNRSIENSTRERFLRQHSTPAAIQECLTNECSSGPSQNNERKYKLQKSTSLDEACTKTKMATCLIKSVLSKKMQNVDTQPDGEDVCPDFEENSPQTESKPDAFNLSSSVQSDFSLSSEDLFARQAPKAKDEVKTSKSFGGKSSNRPSSSCSSSVNFSQSESEEVDSESRQTVSLRSVMRSEVREPLETKHSKSEAQQVHDNKTWDGRGDSGKAKVPSTEVSRVQTMAPNINRESENTELHKQLQQDNKGVHTSTPEKVSQKGMEKRKASLNVCLTPEAENKYGASSPDMSYREREEKTEKDESNGGNHIKAPIHKVRDVRRLVKNTHNLSFKTAGTVMTSNVNEEMMGHFNDEMRKVTEEMKDVQAREEREERQKIRRGEMMEEKENMFMVEKKEKQKKEGKDSKLLTSSPTGNRLSGPQPMQIEYKAVCWKDEKNKQLCSMRDSNANTEKTADRNFTKSCQHDLNMPEGMEESTTEMHEVTEDEEKYVPVRTDRRPQVLGGLPKTPNKDREVSTAVVLIREGSDRTKTSVPVALEMIPSPVPAPGASRSPGPTIPAGSGHSVSMLLKEKGYQADIGAVVGDQNAAGDKRIPCKHVNSVKIPLQLTIPSDPGQIHCEKERQFCPSPNMTGPSALSDTVDTLTKTRDHDGVSNNLNVRDTENEKNTSFLMNAVEQIPPPTKQKEKEDFEAVKRLDPTFPPKSPRRFRPQPIKFKSVSKETQKQEIPVHSAASSRPQTIEVKSIAKNSQKPAVPPKPSCKFKPADTSSIPNDAHNPSTTAPKIKPQGEDRPRTTVVSSPTIYQKISNDSTSASNYTRKLSVAAISSLKPPPGRTTETSTGTLSNQSAALSKTEVSHDSCLQQKLGASPQGSSKTQRPTTLATGPVSVAEGNQVPGPVAVGTTHQQRQTAVDLDNRAQHTQILCPHNQTMPVASMQQNAKEADAASTIQLPGYPHQPHHRAFSRDQNCRTDDLQMYTSDDPPSYDERESFSPLMPPDLTARRPNHYQPSSNPPPCSCTAGPSSYSGLPPQRHRSPHNPTPPAAPHSPGQILPYPLAQPPLRPHQCKSDLQQIGHQPGSPKSSPLGPNQAPALYQHFQQPPPCPPHASLIQACPADRPLQPPQHIDSRRPSVHRSPQQHPPSMAGASYCNPNHNHSPGLPPIDPQYLCGHQSLGTSFGSEYGGDSSSLYSESTYGQTPRRVLLDPETGKYFYIEVPVQPLRKMLFDPETGQYVEVLIPQQTMSQSGLYPPSAAPYPPLHNSGMYAAAPHYMPYATPPMAHPQTQSQPPQYPEASAAATMHQSGPGVSYRNVSGQASKPEPQSHPPLDRSYLENMYYVPTGMTASPNPTPPDYYKHPPNLPPMGGKRS